MTLISQAFAFMEKEDKRRICFSIPCLNEASNIELVAKEVDEVFCAEARYVYEVSFIDNCSIDAARERIQGLFCSTRQLQPFPIIVFDES